MKRPCRDPVRLLVGVIDSEPSDAVDELAGGLAREGHGDDMTGVRAAFANPEGDTAGQDSCLAGARRREDRKGSLAGRDGATLVRVEVVEQQVPHASDGTRQVRHADRKPATQTSARSSGWTREGPE